jgi:ATP-binding cassette subfamily C (CFTR/MRP) protein 1
MVILESTEKRKMLFPPYKEYPEEAISGTFNRGFFFWLNSLFLNGYKNILSLSDLFLLNKDMCSEKLYEEFQSAWDEG